MAKNKDDNINVLISSKNKQHKKKKEWNISKPNDRPIQEFYHDPTNSHLGLTNKLGTPAHVTYLSRQDGDERRHKSKCVYHDNTDKKCLAPKEGCYMLKCAGSSHCRSYITEQNLLDFEKQAAESVSKNTPKRIKEDIVSYGDTVLLYCHQDKERMYIQMKANYNDMPPIQKACLNRRNGTKFTLLGYSYRIQDIIKK